MPKGVYPRTKEHNVAVSKARQGMRFPNRKLPPPFTEETRMLMRINAKRVNGRNWRGGEEGDYYASILCPLGYVREYHYIYAFPKRFLLDFALVVEKINIELDGVWHMTTKQEDRLRDELLRRDGWKIIRIKV